MIIPVGFAQVNMLFTGGALPRGAQVTFGVDLEDPGDDPTAVANHVILSATSADFMDSLVDDIVLSSVLVKFGPVATGPSVEVPCDIDGGASSSGVSPNVSLLVKKVTSAGGRSGRGRFYLPGAPESMVTDAGNIDSSAGSTLQGQLDSFLGTLATAGVPMVLLHADLSAPIDTPLPVTDLLLDGRAATQRRRLRG